MSRLAITVAALIAAAGFARGEVRLPKMLSSHAVLQRDRPIHIWGWAEPGESVSVSLADATDAQKSTANARSAGDQYGRWSVFLPPRHAGGPFTLTVNGTNRIVVDDLLMGDVWFASGQSNMEMPLSGFPGSAVVNNADEEIKHATNSNLRLLLIPHAAEPNPLTEFEGEFTWTVCTPETASKFSAVAYFFGREIAAREHVPIGLIDSTWGGTPAEAWVSMDALSRDASLMPVFASWAQMSDEQADASSLLKAEQIEDEKAKAAHAPPPKHPWHPDSRSWDPSWLFNGMVAPATPYPIKGVIWYQGESNSSVDRAPMYHKVFSSLIQDWRKHWSEGEFPFLFTQISSFNPNDSENWPIVRQGQLETLSLANTAMAVTIDVGDPNNVHPSDKQTVGMRLALGARAVAYHENVPYSGPLFRQAVPENGSLRLWFDHTGAGLRSKGDSLQGFEIAGSDHRFRPATARIESDTVVVTSTDVTDPEYVRYGWRDAPTVNLYNAADLPASPFTSDLN